MHSAAFALPRTPTVLARDRGGARAGSVRAEHEFRRLYDANAQDLLRYLMRSTGDTELAQDLLQEAFFRYVRVGFAGESDKHRRRYLFKIAGNLICDHYRRAQPATVDLDSAPPMATAPARDIGRDLARLMAELSVRDRQLLWLAHAEGFSHREIGEVMGLACASVRPALFRARKRLRRILKSHGIGAEVLS